MKGEKSEKNEKWKPKKTSRLLWKVGPCVRKFVVAAQSGRFLGVLQNRNVSYSFHCCRERHFTMNLSSLNVDVLLHLIKFVKPVDRFNLALSGILKGFENVKGIDPDKRYSQHFTMCQCK